MQEIVVPYLKGVLIALFANGVLLTINFVKKFTKKTIRLQKEGLNYCIIDGSFNKAPYQKSKRLFLIAITVFIGPFSSWLYVIYLAFKDHSDRYKNDFFDSLELNTGDYPVNLLLDTKKSRFTIYSRTPDWHTQTHTIFEYKIEDTNIFCRTIERWSELDGIKIEYEVKDNVVLEAEIRERTELNSFLTPEEQEQDIQSLIQTVQWHRVKYEIEFFILSIALQKNENVFKKYLRSESERIKNGIRLLKNSITDPELKLTEFEDRVAIAYSVDCADSVKASAKKLLSKEHLEPFKITPSEVYESNRIIKSIDYYLEKMVPKKNELKSWEFLEILSILFSLLLIAFIIIFVLEKIKINKNFSNGISNSVSGDSLDYLQSQQDSIINLFSKFNNEFNVKFDIINAKLIHGRFVNDKRELAITKINDGSQPHATGSNEVWLLEWKDGWRIVTKLADYSYSTPEIVDLENDGIKEIRISSSDSWQGFGFNNNIIIRINEFLKPDTVFAILENFDSEGNYHLISDLIDLNHDGISEILHVANNGKEEFVTHWSLDPKYNGKFVCDFYYNSSNENRLKFLADSINIKLTENLETTNDINRKSYLAKILAMSAYNQKSYV